MSVDNVPRYAPSAVFCAGRVRPVKRFVAYPPGEHPKGCPLVADCTAVEFVTDGGSRWYGFDKAWINSELRMVVQGFPEADEVRRRWSVCAQI